MHLAANAKRTTNLCLVITPTKYFENITYVTCDTRNQKCCDVGCCDRVFVLDKEENLWLAWIMVLFMSFLMSFTIICLKMMCKESCKQHTQDQSSILNLQEPRGGHFVQRQPQTANSSRRVVFLQTEGDESDDNTQTDDDGVFTPPPSYEEAVSGQLK